MLKGQEIRATGRYSILHLPYVPVVWEKTNCLASVKTF